MHPLPYLTCRISIDPNLLMVFDLRTFMGSAIKLPMTMPLLLINSFRIVVNSCSAIKFLITMLPQLCFQNKTFYLFQIKYGKKNIPTKFFFSSLVSSSNFLFLLIEFGLKWLSEGLRKKSLSKGSFPTLKQINYFKGKQKHKCT